MAVSRSAKPKPTTLGPWPKGVDELSQQTDLDSSALRQAVNVDLDKLGNPHRRLGRASVYSGTKLHSLWGYKDLALFMENGVLKSLQPDYTAITLRSNLDVHLPLSYTYVAGQVYYANGRQYGRVSVQGEHTVWGVGQPSGQPTLQATSTGSLSAGNYQVAVTFLDAAGQESGTGLAATVELTVSGSIQLSDIPQSSAATHVRVYMTEANGDTLYHAFDLAMGIDPYIISRSVKGKLLTTQFLQPLPVGHIVRYYNGRIYTANGNALYFTDPLHYGLCSLANNFFLYPERITIVEPVEDGIFIVADQTYFLRGNDAKDFKERTVHDKRGVEGTGLSVSAKAFPQEDEIVPEGNVAYWFGEGGGVIGYAGGIVRPAMENKLALENYDVGATMFRETRGIKQLVTSLQGRGHSSGFAARDIVTATVIRNGVVILNVKHMGEFRNDYFKNRYEQMGDGGLFLPRSGVILRGEFENEVIHEGVSLGKDCSPNLVVNEGLDETLDIMLSAATQITLWYISVFKANYTPLATDTAANISSNSTEILSTDVDETVRESWTDGGVSGQSIDNSAARAEYNIAASITAYGAWLVGGDSAFAGVSGSALFAASKFSSSRVLVSGDDLLVQYTITAADA